MAKKWLAMSAAALAFAPVASAMALQEVPAPAPAAGDVSIGDEPVVVLARRICERVRTLEPDSDTTRFEAEMVYALSQSGANVEVQAESLRRVRTLCPMGGGMELALANADASISRGGTAGTAAIAASLGQGGFDTGSSFSSPAVDLGGGSVNYTTS